MTHDHDVRCCRRSVDPDSAGLRCHGATRVHRPLHRHPSFTVHCGDFTALVEGTATSREVVFYDSDGKLDRRVQLIRSARDLWTNTVTGNRSPYAATCSRPTPPTRTDKPSACPTRGFKHLVDEPGTEVTVTEVGRIVYGDVNERTGIFQAGPHVLADPALIEPPFDDVISA